MKKYIGFLLLLVFIFGTNNGFAEIEEPQQPITSEEVRNTLILQEINRCQASIYNISKLINVTDAVLSTLEPESNALNKIGTIREVLRDKYDLLTQMETKALENLENIKADVPAINNEAVTHFEFIAKAGVNVFNSSHTDEGYKSLAVFLVTILQEAGSCEAKISEYLKSEIQG
jgi:hypothetical protein